MGHNDASMRLIRLLGSLAFAVFLLGLLVVVLTVSTALESAYGTPFAQRTFYTALWFDGVLGLVAVNIFCATLTRWPFKKKHAGFVVTHAGILALLAGALLTRLWGSEGTMMLFEGEAKSRIEREGHALRVITDGRLAAEAVLKEGRTRLPYPLDAPGASVEVLDYTPHAIVTRGVEEASGGGPNPAALVHFKSEAMGADERFWLVKHDPADPGASSRQVGPATVELRVTGREPASTLTLVQRSSGRHFHRALPAPVTLEVGFDGLKIENLRYFPQAKISEGRLVNDPASVKFNPAVQFDVTDGKRTETHTRFFLFPGYGSVKGGEAADRFGLDVGLSVELPDEAKPVPAPALLLFADEKGAWRYRVTSTKSAPLEGVLTEGQTVQTGWMDIAVTVEKLVGAARIKEEVTADPSKKSRLFAVKIKVPGGDAFWLPEGSSHRLPGGNAVQLRTQSDALPFSLRLKDFRKVDYPGTSSAASFESDVVLTDREDGVQIERTISMNKPLDYKGWRVFQSSYVQDPRFGEASVFSIAKNPGIGLIYSGAAVILAGVLLLFYWHPFFQKRASGGA